MDRLSKVLSRVRKLIARTPSSRRPETYQRPQLESLERRDAPSGLFTIVGLAHNGGNR